MGSKLENILILGIGGVGMHLARRLVHEGASVTVIETDPKLVQEAAETMDARVLKGNSMSLSSWRAAEAESIEPDASEDASEYDIEPPGLGPRLGCLRLASWLTAPTSACAATGPTPRGTRSFP